MVGQSVLLQLAKGDEVLLAAAAAVTVIPFIRCY